MSAGAGTLIFLILGVELEHEFERFVVIEGNSEKGTRYTHVPGFSLPQPHCQLTTVRSKLLTRQAA